MCSTLAPGNPEASSSRLAPGDGRLNDFFGPEGGGVRKFVFWRENPLRRNLGIVVFLGAENSGKRNVVYLGAKNPGRGAMDNAPEKKLGVFLGVAPWITRPKKILEVFLTIHKAE